MKKMLISVVALGMLSLAQPAIAENSNGIGIKAGTLGLGAEYTHSFNDYLNMRAGVNWLNWEHDFSTDDVSYKGDLQLQSFSLLADYHPFGNGFRLTGGALYNGNTVDVTAKPTAGSYSINGVRYPAAAINSITGEVSFSSIAPYLGLGWGRDAQSNSHWSFNFDLGILYQGEADPDINGHCSPMLPAAACAHFQKNLAVEEQKIKDEVNDIKIYPVISFGVTYNF